MSYGVTTILDRQETDSGICYVIECLQPRFTMAELEQLEYIGIELTGEQRSKKLYYVECGQHGEKYGWSIQIEGDVVGEEGLAESKETCRSSR